MHFLYLTPQHSIMLAMSQPDPKNTKIKAKETKFREKQKTKEERIAELLTRGVVEVADQEHLKNQLLNPNITLRVKLGLDPTGARLHIGRGATLLKLKEFQDLGHKIVFIIGDGTAQIGDPSDKSSSRKGLTPEQISQNSKDYLAQISKILDISQIEVVHNSAWIKNIPLAVLLKLMSCQSLQEITKRENFAKRIERGDSVSFLEAFYPLLQGYDSVMIKADVELGGTDQTFNLSKGRDVQRAFGLPPQDYITTQLLIGLDGEKMSTSLGNCIWINDSPEVKYTQIMKLADPLIPTYMECATRLPMELVHKTAKGIKEGTINAMEAKKVLAREIVRMYDGEEMAKEAEEFFEKTVQKMEIPISTLKRYVEPGEIDIKLLADLLVETNLAKSKAEVRRLIEQGGFYINGVPMDPQATSVKLEKNKSIIVRLGKRSLSILEVVAKA